VVGVEVEHERQPGEVQPCNRFSVVVKGAVDFSTLAAAHFARKVSDGVRSSLCRAGFHRRVPWRLAAVTSRYVANNSWTFTPQALPLPT
jgi:hypothetical protein